MSFGGSRGRALSLSISTWFLVPGEMKKFEILNRASAFLIHAKNTKFPYKAHVVTSSHVVAPWRWPKYYPDEWLQCVNQDHCHYTVEVRDENGVFTTQSDLHPCVFHHPNRDMAVLHFDRENETLALLASIDVKPMEIASDDEFLKHKNDLRFYGHDVVGDSVSTEDERRPVPWSTTGQIAFATDHQLFAKTTNILPQGMCGGPVVVGRSDNVAGVVEGIVPLEHENKELQGLSVFVDPANMRKFLTDVEDNKIKPIVSSQAYSEVMKKADKNDMNLAKLLQDHGY